MNPTARECLVIFTRYPEAGKTKTRMIRALGAEGAATLQRQMTEQTITRAKKLTASRPLVIEVHFAGGTEQLMQEWLGLDLVYRFQGEGDLGRRMNSAFEATLAKGITRVVIIGTDCPDLEVKLLTEAFDALSQHDLVLGPAEDGGYYLIGLRRLIPELFEEINWGTSQVREQTVEIAQRLNLAISYLTLLSDIDRPEDLVGQNFDFDLPNFQ